ncbi:NUDIX domain-containing protein [Kitasatospora sp. NPDC127111]|uniref:NUDIX domain-containing protein n=1 Tax=Kitasatospora sp. NPDC127111 TaxID=3345363 RepID=UPI0036331E52
MTGDAATPPSGRCPTQNWGYPAGGLNYGEDPLQGALRELVEEGGTRNAALEWTDPATPPIVLSRTSGISSVTVQPRAVAIHPTHRRGADRNVDGADGPTAWDNDQRAGRHGGPSDSGE